MADILPFMAVYSIMYLSFELQMVALFAAFRELSEQKNYSFLQFANYN